MSVCPNSGGNYHPCSQSQKMSIGLFVEAVCNPCSGSMKVADASITRTEKEASNMERVMEKHVQRVKASSSPTMSKNDFHDNSKRVITGSLAANMLMKDPNHIVSHVSNRANICLHAKQPTHTVVFFADRALSESGIGKKTEADRTSGKKSRKLFMNEQKFPGASKQQVCVPVNNELLMHPNAMQNRCKEALRMNLREILGVVPSNGNISSNIRTHKVDADKMKREQTFKGDDNFKRRQSFETIETDSENVDLIIKKPVTHSLSRKRACARIQSKKLKPKTVLYDREGQQGSDIFSFAENSAPSPPYAANRACLKFEKNDHVKRSCGVEPGDKVSPVTDSRNIQLEKIASEKAQPVEELPLSGEVASLNHDSHDKKQPKAAMQNLNFNPPVARQINQLPNLVPQEKSENLEPFGSHFPVHHVHDLNSQWFKVTKVMLDSPMGSDLPTNNNKQHVQESVQLERGVVHQASRLFKNSTISEKQISEFSDDDDNIDYSQTSTSTPSIEEKDAGNGLFIPELDNTEEVSFAKEVHPEVEDVHTSPEISFVRKPMLFRSKRRCCHGVNLNDLSPTLHAPKVSENADDVLKCFDDIPEDGLARVVSLLGLALEKVKSKMLLVTNKKCSEILVSAAEEIHLQLCSVESQIQSDLEKISSLKTSKRNHLEARLQEQEGHLKVMHEKLKEEICRYVQDCKGAMEGLETQHIELQVAMEKQKALHKKLLLQTKAAVETHLIDAQKQMTFVHKLGKQKMQMLKLTIAQCLNDIY